MSKRFQYIITNHRRNRAFTIVELLVVVVIIAVLAAISLVMYSGISQKAVASVLQSDLSNASTAIKAFQVEQGNFPLTVSTNCATTPDSSTNKCLKLSGGNAVVGYSANNSASPKSFLLIVNNGINAYKVTDRSGPAQIATNTIQPGTTPGALVELHGARANAGTSQGINAPLTTTWADTSGNGNNGTVTNFTGSPWVGAGTFANPYRLTFDGANDFVSLPLLGVTASRMLTFEAWVTTTDMTSTFRRIFAEDDIPGNIDVSLWISGGMAYGLVRATGHPDAYFMNGTNIADGNQHHVVMSWNNTTGWLAVDGSAGGSTNVEAFTINPNVTSLGSNSGSAPYWIGTIAVARVYPFALTATQASANYNAGPDW